VTWDDSCVGECRSRHDKPERKFQIQTPEKPETFVDNARTEFRLHSTKCQKHSQDKNMSQHIIKQPSNSQV
jgi:hypothetical protein